MVKFAKNLFGGLVSNILWISLVFGLLALALGHTDIYFREESYWREFFKAVGNIVLASGIFMAIAKSYQFTNIFKDELRSVVYSQEHLEKRNDLVNIWEKVTEALTERKFPDISKKLQKNIREYYLPIKQNFYFKDYNYTIHIDIDVDDPNYLILKESTETTIITQNNKTIADYKFSTGIPFPSDDNAKTYYKLNKVSINSKDVDVSKHLTVDYDKKNGVLKTEFKYNLDKKAEKYNIIKEEEKRYHIKSNPYKSHQATWIYHNLFVDLFYPNNLLVDFQGMGVFNKFNLNKTDMQKMKRMRAKYTGLIFPKQGFFIHFTKD